MVLVKTSESNINKIQSSTFRGSEQFTLSEDVSSMKRKNYRFLDLCYNIIQTTNIFPGNWNVWKIHNTILTFAMGS